MRELWRPVLQSAGAGTVNRMAALSIRLFTIPLLLRYLGHERYGLWMTVASISAYLTLLDLGIVSALVNRLTVLYQRGGGTRAHTYVFATTSCLVALAAVGGVAAAVAVLHTDIAGLLKLSSPLGIAEAKPLALVAIGMGCAQLATAALLRVPYTMQRGYLTEGYSLLGNLVSFAGLLGAVGMRGGLPYLAAALMAGPVIAALGVTLHLLVTGGLRVIRPSTRRFGAVYGRLRRSAPDFILMQTVATLLVALQFTLLGVFRGAGAVTPYSLMSQAVLALQVPLSVLQQPLWTKFAALHAAKQPAAIRRMFAQYLGVAAVYSVLAGAVLIWLTNPLLALVLSEPMRIDLGLRVGFAGLCALGLLAGGNLGALILGLDLTRTNARLSIAQLLVFVVGAVTLTPRFGDIGMVASVMLTYAAAVPLLLITLPRHLGDEHLGSTVPRAVSVT